MNSQVTSNADVLKDSSTCLPTNDSLEENVKKVRLLFRNFKRVIIVRGFSFILDSHLKLKCTCFLLQFRNLGFHSFLHVDGYFHAWDIISFNFRALTSFMAPGVKSELSVSLRFNICEF